MILAAVFVINFGKLWNSPESLLDGEEFDDDERNALASTRSYPHPIQPATFSTLNLMKYRTSEIGSRFREEVLPTGFIDPISKQSSKVDLSSIVDDVMRRYAISLVGWVPGMYQVSSKFWSILRTIISQDIILYAVGKWIYHQWLNVVQSLF